MQLFRLDSKSEDYNKAERSACLSYDEGTEGVSGLPGDLLVEPICTVTVLSLLEKTLD